MTEIGGHVTGLNIFPIKSCHAATVDGITPTKLEVGMTGFEAYGMADRDYVLVESGDDPNIPAHFVTQRGRGLNNRADRANRNDRQLAMVRPNITPNGLEIAGPEDFGSVVISAESGIGGDKVDVNIFGKLMVGAIDQGDDPARLFSDFLGRSVRLVRANRSSPRQVSLHNRADGASNIMAAADSLPFLLVSQSSLNQSPRDNSFEGTVPISQYRANIVIDGDPKKPYDEDYWREIKIGDMTAFVVKACQRCPIPGIDQESGEPGAGGQKVLRGRLGFIDDPSDKALVFGQNLNHVFVPGTIVSVNDPVELCERAPERNFTFA